MGSCVIHFNVSLICVGKVTETVSINDKFLRQRRAEADRPEVLLLTGLAPYRSATLAHMLLTISDSIYGLHRVAFGSRYMG